MPFQLNFRIERMVDMTNEVVIDETNVLEQHILSGYNDLLNVADLSKLFGVSKQTIYKEIKCGKFGKPITIGRSLKVSKIYIIKKIFCSCK